MAEEEEVLEEEPKEKKKAAGMMPVIILLVVVLVAVLGAAFWVKSGQSGAASKMEKQITRIAEDLGRQSETPLTQFATCKFTMEALLNCPNSIKPPS